MSRPTMRVITPEPIGLMNDNQMAAQEANRQRCEATKARFARDKLARESNLTMAPKYRPCPDGCGLTLLWGNRGYHPIPEDLEPTETTPNIVSQMQVRWARGELRRAQNGKMTRLSVPELEALANTPLAGLPERTADKKATKPTPRKRQARSDAL